MDYTDLYNFQTSAGIIVPNDASVLKGIQEKFQEIFGTDIDLSAETPVGRLIEAFSVVVKTTLGVTAQTANQFNVNEATGIYLDSIAQIYDLKRIAGTKTRITVKCTFSSNDGGNQVPQGALVMSSANGALFRIDSTIPVAPETDEEGNYYGVGTATALQIGPITAPEGAVNSIQTAVLGWTGVTNVSPTYIGTDIETDEAFRKRIMESRPVGIGFNDHLASALNRLDGVYSACILENNTGTQMSRGVAREPNPVVIPAHSIFVCVDCIETEDLLADIAKEVSRAKPIGTGMVNEKIGDLMPIVQTIDYGYNNGYSQTISFYKAKKKAILVDLTFSYGNYTGDDIIGDIERVVADYMDTIGVGNTIYASMIANRLINELNIGIGTIWVQKAGSTVPAGNLVEMMGYEVPYTLAENITATQKA